MASTNFVVKNGLTVASGTVVAGGSSGTNGQVLASTGTGVQWVNAATGTGDVVGPASATDNAVTRFDTTSGKLIQSSTVTLDDNGNFNNVNSVVLDTTPATLPTSAGTLYWEDGEGTPEVILKGGNTTLKVGTQEYARVYNDSGSTITLGQVVYISGAQGNRVAVKLAQADVEANSFGTLGLVAETIANGAEGWIIVSGALYKLNTLGLTAGAVVYLSPTTAGAYTTTKPQAPDQLVVLGFIERVSSTVGSIYVKVDNGYELDELHDVRITSPISGNTLIYDATTSPTGVWKNASLTAGTGISVTNGAGSITIGNTGVTSVSGTSPVVSSGTATPAISLASGYGDTQNPYGSKTANYFLAAPDGSAGSPTFRAIVAADIPTLNQNTTGTAANVTGIVAVANGGTGLTTLTAGYIPYGNGTSAFGSSANLFWDSTNSRLGVGTSSPRAKLETSGSIFATSRSIPTGGAGPEIWWSGTVSGISSYDRTNSAYKPLLLEAEYSYFTTANGSEQMRINNTGVGIGTASPYNKLEIEGASARLGLNNGGGASRKALLIEPLGYGGNAYARLESYDYGTSTGGVLALNVTGGNVGIGTVSPSAKLQVNSSGITPLNLVGSAACQINLNDGTQNANWGLGVGGVGITGIASPSTYPLVMYTNGSERMRIDSSGNVGIGGTASSGTRLYVVGSNTTSNTSIPIYANQVYGNTGVSSAALRLNLNDGAGGCYLYGYSGGAGFMHNAEYLAGTGWTARSTFASIMETTSSGFSFYLNSSLTAGNTFTPSEQMRLTSTGLGIGTSNPLARLDIVGDATPNGNGLAFGHANTAGYKWIQSFASQALYINPLGNNVIFNRDGGSVGIGTVSPASKLNVSGGNVTVSAGYGIAYSADQNRIMTPEDNVSGALIAWASGGICRFLTASTERMRIDSSGNVGIGRTPSYTLDLAGDARFKRNSGSGWVFQTPSSDMRIVGETSGAHLCFIPSSANVGIDTTSPSEKLNVIGKIKASDVLLGNNGTKGFGAVTTTTSTSTPTGGSSGDHYYIY